MEFPLFCWNSRQFRVTLKREMLEKFSSISRLNVTLSWWRCQECRHSPTTNKGRIGAFELEKKGQKRNYEFVPHVNGTQRRLLTYSPSVLTFVFWPPSTWATTTQNCLLFNFCSFLLAAILFCLSIWVLNCLRAKKRLLFRKKVANGFLDVAKRFLFEFSESFIEFLN